MLFKKQEKTISMALAGLLKLRVNFCRVPVKKIYAAGDTQVERAVACEPSQVGSKGPP